MKKNSCVRGKINFGTDGWRAEIADTFTFENLGRLAIRLADYVGKNSQVCVGYDNRFLSAEYASFFAAVLEQNGVRVDLSDSAVPTPCVSHRVTRQGYDLGACISASHNPASYNGLKLKENYGGSARCELVAELTEGLSDTSYDGPRWSLKYHGKTSDWGQDYLAELEKYLPEGNLRVGVDYFHGTGSPFFGELLKRKGYIETALRAERDPLFGGINPEPRPQYLGELMGLLKSGRADIGFAFDGDADRIALVDENGRFLSMQVILAVLAWDMLDSGKEGRIIKTVAGTCLVDRMAEKYKAELEIVPIGFKNICPEMLKGDVLVAGEESGGIGFGDFLPERDALYTALRILEMMKRRSMLFGEIWDEVSCEFGGSYYLREDFPCAGSFSREEFLQKVSENIKVHSLPYKVEEVSYLDGGRIDMEGGRWLLIRPSGTEPLLRLYAEGEDKSAAEKLIRSGRELFNEQ
ncbi:MAG: phosphoglucomutase/phosphomannomutase family protein [Elusimicrobia bacterium]|nr:phosphoglucomutase/phosphomannomutase family protein [Elusimicrobiota bacterium]